jgi:toxin ParE1/3/4
MEKIEWSKLAIADLQSIHEYISQDSAFYANRMMDKIAGRIDQPQNFPQSRRVVPELNNEMIRELSRAVIVLFIKLKMDTSRSHEFITRR